MKLENASCCVGKIYLYPGYNSQAIIIIYSYLIDLIINWDEVDLLAFLIDAIALTTPAISHLFTI